MYSIDLDDILSCTDAVAIEELPTQTAFQLDAFQSDAFQEVVGTTLDVVVGTDS